VFIPPLIEPETQRSTRQEAFRPMHLAAYLTVFLHPQELPG
jgi:hypothetical protein